MDIFNEAFSMTVDQFKEKYGHWVVQHFSQRDNPDYKGAHGWQECFNSANCQTVSFKKPYHDKNADFDQMKKVLDSNPADINGYKAWQVHEFWVKFYKDLGYKNSVAFAFSKEKAIEILKYRPFTLGTYLTDGHMTTALAIKDDGMTIEDPYGRWPYVTEEDKNWTKPYFRKGFDWLYDKKGNVAWSLDIN